MLGFRDASFMDHVFGLNGEGCATSSVIKPFRSSDRPLPGRAQRCAHPAPQTQVQHRAHFALSAVLPFLVTFIS
jgi:hypothetical protein